MINLNLKIRNPWSRRFSILKTWHGTAILDYKFWEFQANRNSDIIGFEFSISLRQDHAGFIVGLSIFSFEILFTLYDVRHWNQERSCWENE